MIAIVDCETTSLNRDTMFPWEITIIRRPWNLGSENDRIVRTYMVAEPDLTDADMKSLRISGYHQRHPLGEIGNFGPGKDPEKPSFIKKPDYPGEFFTLNDEDVIARDVEWMIRDAHLVAAQPAFDERALGNLLQRNGLALSNHHRSYCVESMVSARRGAPIASLGDSAQVCGIDCSQYERHTSRGDALLVERLFDSIMGIR